jgi:serine/threonine protein kinase
MLTSITGSKAVDNPVWLAPELMRKEGYDEKVDVYSYGVILWELVAREDFLGHITFLSAIEDAVLNGERPKIPGNIFHHPAQITRPHTHTPHRHDR